MKLRCFITLCGALLCGALLTATGALFGGDPPRTGLVRGTIFELQPGELSLRSLPGDIYRFRFDNRTWIERARERIAGSSLRTGELLEVVSDRDGQPQYARLIHVLDRSVPRPPVREGQFRLYRKRSEDVTTPDFLLYTGVALSVSERALTLRTRLDGVKTIYLRADTHYLSGGTEVPVKSLLNQTHILVQAIRNPDQELEATRIIWGELLIPDRNK